MTTPHEPPMSASVIEPQEGSPEPAAHMEVTCPRRNGWGATGAPKGSRFRRINECSDCRGTGRTPEEEKR